MSPNAEMRKYIERFMIKNRELFLEDNKTRKSDANAARNAAWTSLQGNIRVKYGKELTITQLQNQWKMIKRNAVNQLRTEGHGDELKYRTLTGGGLDVKKERKYSKTPEAVNVKSDIVEILRGTPAITGITKRGFQTPIKVPRKRRLKIATSSESSEEDLTMLSEEEDEFDDVPIDGGSDSDEQIVHAPHTDFFNEDSLETRDQIETARIGINPSQSDVLKLQFKALTEQQLFYKEMRASLHVQTSLFNKLIEKLDAIPQPTYVFEQNPVEDVLVVDEVRRTEGDRNIQETASLDAPAYLK